MPNIFEADSIRKSYGENQVLTDVYLYWQTGDIIGLLGRNGSGKSTLFKILFGTLNTNDKHISINGKQFESPFKGKNLVSFLPQDDFLPKSMTVKRVMQLFGDRLNDLVFFNDPVLSKVYNTKIGNLSGGELRYLEIMLILSINSKFVFLDEPFNGISPIQAEIVKDFIKKQSESKGIILTDHNYRNVLDLANKYMILLDGGIKILDSKKELIYLGYLPDDIKR